VEGCELGQLGEEQAKLRGEVHLFIFPQCWSSHILISTGMLIFSVEPYFFVILQLALLLTWIQSDPVLRIHGILVWIRICGSMPLQWIRIRIRFRILLISLLTFKMPTKTNLFV
jgi:hypothetical protein